MYVAGAYVHQEMGQKCIGTYLIQHGDSLIVQEQKTAFAVAKYILKF